MNPSKAALDVYDLDLLDNPARDVEADCYRCVRYAVLAGLGALLFTPLSAFLQTWWAYLANGAIAFLACLLWHMADRVEKYFPLMEIPLSARDEALVEAYLSQIGALQAFRELNRDQRKPTYATVRDLMVKAAKKALTEREGQ